MGVSTLERSPWHGSVLDVLKKAGPDRLTHEAEALKAYRASEIPQGRKVADVVYERRIDVLNLDEAQKKALKAIDPKELERRISEAEKGQHLVTDISIFVVYDDIHKFQVRGEDDGNKDYWLDKVRELLGKYNPAAISFAKGRLTEVAEARGEDRSLVLDAFFQVVQEEEASEHFDPRREQTMHTVYSDKGSGTDTQPTKQVRFGDDFDDDEHATQEAETVKFDPDFEGDAPERPADPAYVGKRR